ncbi:MAG: response regulator [Proteobacteria bacterium]|nr:response regulator [Pseudomonadota bacterium]
MDDYRYTVLCVDDEESVLSSMRRLLRREDYQFLTASSGEEGLKILAENDVHLVVSDQRMPQVSGTEFLAVVKERYPDVIRVILTGYTDVNSITESINKGHVYKFLLKPWNDDNLKLDIKRALEQYGLVRANKELHEMVLQQNEELQAMNENLQEMNENLEVLVRERTEKLEVQNRALELSRQILEDLPVPIIGVSAEGTIVLINKVVNDLSFLDAGIDIGRELTDYFPGDVQEKVTAALTTNLPQTLDGYELSGTICDLDLTPLSWKFSGKGVILTIKQIKGKG